MPEPTEGVALETLMKAVVALLVDARTDTDREARLKSETLLAGVGLSAPEIAGIMGKQASAVRMTLSRARKGTK